MALGAFPGEGGVDFSVYSSVATLVELCIFSEDFSELKKIPLTRSDDDTWHAFVPGTGAGTIYAYRVHGEFAPGRGLFANPQKLLLDPHAKALVQAPDATLGVVVDDAFSWENDSLPRIPFAKNVVYEAHVRGLTKNFPGLSEDIRGTYAALAHDSVIHYLKDLGVTTLEFLPVHAKCDDRFLVDKGLTNYWGYSTLSFFAPEPRYAAGKDAVLEFKTMVKALHRAGIEVILDVVYNHTAEQGADGPLLSLRGFDNRAYYLFEEGRGFIDHTGCGNTLNFAHPQTRRFVLESLRYWATEMHVDGFRFDLAPALFREGGSPNTEGAFGRELLSDPVLSRLKLIAEPWDLGPEGYARDKFGEPWFVWNDRFRDAARRFWRGDDASDDLLKEIDERRVINFITCHDGFTLKDLVSYSQKHNAANLEDNRDGASENFSCNYGIEGDSNDPAVREIRLRQRKNMIATLIFARGTPMLLAGDETGHTQNGNNNAYCQDNAITHLTWPGEPELAEFIRYAIDLRSRYNWEDAAISDLPVENRAALGFALLFPDGKSLAILFNASESEKAVFSLPGKDTLYRELINTAAALSEETRSGILIVPPRGACVLQKII
jgi:isoamylase